MKALEWLFPIGAILSIYGVLVELLLRLDEATRFEGAHGITIPSDWGYRIYVTMPLSLFCGALLILAGSIMDRKVLPICRTKPRGMACWILSVVSVFFMVAHKWGFDDTAIELILPHFQALLEE